MQNIILENEIFKLILTEDGRAESLVLKQTGKECLCGEKLPFFTLTEQRPYNNEIKLAHPTRQTTFGASNIRIEGKDLIVSFEHIHFEAVIRVDLAPRYMVFTLTDFIVHEDSFGIGVEPIEPPVYELRLVQLPVLPFEKFGEWLNVQWDDTVAVNVLAACPYVKIGSEERKDHRVLYGEVLRDVKLKNAGTALIVSKPEELLDSIEALENDYDLPRGVASRRSPYTNQSYYSAGGIDPTNVDEHIALAKMGGFRYMTVYYSSMFHDPAEFSRTGIYDDFRPEYEKGYESLVQMLAKIKAAGIIPGLHILHSHIGMHTRYLTPVADHRLNLTKHFTLAGPLSKEDTTIYVEECPEGVPTYEKLRVLKFMGELIQYESVSTERPYCFTGCKRGFNDTVVRDHEIGTIGGILDVSEFLALSAYIDQRTSLQDEIAEAIAKIYNAGFEYVYFDGSEGVNAPFDINVGLAQWRVYSKFDKAPLFCEGAAKSHFSWHMLSGANAFDVWKPETFKEMIAAHPFKEAEKMCNDFNRVNFGWWRLDDGQRPDIMEYGTALGAAWDCPGALQANPQRLKELPRAADILEAIRRWEDARACGFVTEAVKAELRKTDIEHTLLVDEAGNFELVPWEQVENAAGDPAVTAFIFTRKGKTCAALWNNAGAGRLSLPLGNETVSYVDDLGGAEIAVEKNGPDMTIPLDKKRYLICGLPKEKLAQAIERAALI